MFDEPSSYLDIKQRLNAAKAIRSLLCMGNYVIVVEHDLAVLDFLSDFICCLYGAPGAYGVVTMPMRVREGWRKLCVKLDTIFFSYSCLLIMTDSILWHSFFAGKLQYYFPVMRTTKCSHILR